ncbi:MAG: DUF4062 domain-containing protein, partial [Candidatus Aminicenantes bacterium]|nr:DUF4062 domain-containing protein [Candidatus Aminicenantes bacterium]
METEPRTIRVFVSSTFRDMQAEREELVKRIFPQLRKLCESRNVTFTEVDLRWGISDEQKAEGKVLPICLAEIQRCQPYFIGLLGERYGWIPKEISQELIETEPWLNEHKNHSVTELEILHGVLNNPEMADHSFFYFRSPEYLNNLPQGSDRKDYLSENAESENKLKNLKERIRKSNLPVRDNYPDPKALGDLVLKDLTEVIDKLFPEGSQPTPLDKEALEHEIFAQSRAKVYIGRKEYFEALDNHAKANAQPLFVLGESGSGKSALLANWALKYKNENPNDLVIMHFIGASASSTDLASMLKRIMGEFKRRFDITQDIPEKTDELRSAFANWLSMASVKGKTILIIDALNQLEDREGALDLVWLPPVIPENIRLILSTLPGKSLDELNKRNWEQLEVKPLDKEERRRLVRDYLSLYTKTLNAERTEKIVSTTQSSNPLFLNALLEELRVFGIYERLDERIDFYLESKDIPELYEKILSRYEEDYEAERPGLIKDSMGLLWASRHGLSETELFELLSTAGNPLPRAVWSPLFLAVEQSLVNRSGLLTFFHEYFRQAIENRYVFDEKLKSEYHLKLADYFDAKELGTRKIEELPWQLAKSKAWERLFDLLPDQEFLLKAWEVDPYDVKIYWAQLEMN